MIHIKEDNIVVRGFTIDDVPDKVEWINNTVNNKYLHYDLPLETEKTRKWYIKNKDREDRIDAVIEVDGIPIGLIGLLQIDKKNKKAEFYICIGKSQYRGKGIALKASRMLVNYGFNKLLLNKIYLFTEVENKPAQNLFSKIGFKEEGILLNDLIYMDRKVDRYVYGLLSKDWDYQNSDI